MKKVNYKKSDLDKVVTLGVLLEFADEVLLPRITETIQQTVAASEYRIKEYVDKKLENHTAELFKRLDKRYEKEKQFRRKVVELFKRHNIGTAEDLAFLDGIVSAN